MEPVHDNPENKMTSEISSTKDATAKPDGRLMRSQRSRQLIIDATLALVEEGNLVPTAQQVADHAKVGIRTVFRHFSDMESMFSTTHELKRATFEYLFIGGDRTGSVDERIQRVTEQRAHAFEVLKQKLLSTQARRWHSEVLRTNYARAQRRLRKDLDDWLPELIALPAAKREAVDSITSFETWHRLREHQSLNIKASIEVIVQMLQLLLAGHSSETD